jgi:hypothetical protein
MPAKPDGLRSRPDSRNCADLRTNSNLVALTGRSASEFASLKQSAKGARGSCRKRFAQLQACCWSAADKKSHILWQCDPSTSTGVGPSKILSRCNAPNRKKSIVNDWVLRMGGPDIRRNLTPQPLLRCAIMSTGRSSTKSSLVSCLRWMSLSAPDPTEDAADFFRRHRQAGGHARNFAAFPLPHFGNNQFSELLCDLLECLIA